MHSKEPWNKKPNGAAFNLQSELKDGPIMICLGMGYQSDAEHEANIQRICDCVNALAGIDDPEDFAWRAKTAIQREKEEKGK